MGPPCRVLQPRLECVAQQFAGRIRVYRVDVAIELPVAGRFGGTSLPAVLVVPAGKEIERLDRLITESDPVAAVAEATRV